VVTSTVAVHPANLAASRARIEAADSVADSRSPASSAMRISPGAGEALSPVDVADMA
jgi:hypothetical protein